MNYLKAYISICRNAMNRISMKNTNVEKHHVFPESIYGNNSFIVLLSLREHYIVHWLLWKLCIKRYGVNSDKTRKMAGAFHWMIYGKNKNRKSYNFSSRVYESARGAAKASKVNKERSDMKGKRYFGANDQTIKNGLKKMSEKKTGTKTNYPVNRKSRGNQTSETISKIKEKRSTTNEKYKKMTADEFIEWVNSYPKYTKDGRRNSNITRAITAREEEISYYYPDYKND